jgi:hypothetical protein
MICERCGANINHPDVFCRKCGAAAPHSAPMPEPDTRHGMSAPAPANRAPVRVFIIIGMIVSLALFFLSWHQKNRLPDSRQILDQMKAEPAQTPTDMAPFNITKNNTTYTITPKYEYDLYGLIVTYHESRSFLDITHKRWGDTINVKDLCVVWGANTAGNIYKKIKFSSADFTCSFLTWDSDTWRRFDKFRVSNNHLITADPRIAKAILGALVGDQVRVKGYLSEYSNAANGFHRGTSTTREDTGNGACETIFVTDFQVLKSNNRAWAFAFGFSGYAFLALTGFAVLRFFMPGRP